MIDKNRKTGTKPRKLKVKSSWKQAATGVS
jgi:hypothetical protein